MKRRYLVDLDALLDRRTKLAQELDELNGMVEFIGKMDKAGVAEDAGRPTAAVEPQQLALKPLGKNRTFTQGARRVLILHLFTGPATEKELHRALAWALDKVHGAIHCAIRDQLVTEIADNPGVYSLTQKGKQAAEFFQKNPSYVRFEPWRGK